MALLLVMFTGCDLVPDIYTPDGARECDPRSAWYQDVDGDGAGNARSVYVGCAAPAGYVADATDCDDTDPDVTTDCGSGDSGS